MIARPTPFDLMTLDDWIALPEDDSAHFELQEGVLLVSPKPGLRHQEALMELMVQLRGQVPSGLKVLFGVEVVVDARFPATVRVPDLIVVPGGRGRERATANEVVLAVEIIAPGSRSLDTRLKKIEYAASCIPHFWLVDPDPPTPSITTFELGPTGDGYRESQTATSELVAADPFPLRVDIDALVAPGE